MHEFDNFTSFDDLEAGDQALFAGSLALPSAVKRPQQEKSLDLPDSFAKDFTLFKDFSDAWVKDAIADSQKNTDESDFIFYSNTGKYAFDTSLVMWNALRDHGLRLRFSDDATTTGSAPVPLPDSVKMSIPKDTTRSNGLYEAFGLIPYSGVLGSQDDTPVASPYRLAVTLVANGWVYNDNLTDATRRSRLISRLSMLGGDQAAALVPRLFMASVIGSCLRFPFKLEDDRLNYEKAEVQKSLDLYDRLAEHGVRPFGIEEFHGIINGAAREAVKTIPELAKLSA